MTSIPPEPLSFAEAGRMPDSADNVAIAVRTLPAGSRILLRQLVFEFGHTILEGHRFAVHRIRKGEPLLSWGLPFGLALRDIEPGEYVCNQKILAALEQRHVPFDLPRSPNFSDYRLPFQLDRASFRPGRQVVAPTPGLFFQGYPRLAARGNRGTGTRNYLLVLGTHSLAGGFAQALAKRFEGIKSAFPNIDGVVAAAHTEGGSAGKPHNFELTLRTLAGFMVNPNVGAVLCVDSGAALLSNEALRAWLESHRYPTEALPHQFFSMQSGWESSLAAASRWIAEALPQLQAAPRQPVPLAELRLGLQCGGSDAFSGVSGNPLLGLISRDVVAQGGSANLAETDELIGAESYVLENVRDLATAELFLKKIERFQEWAAWHGHSAEGNPSGGNMYRGLYNITIKSIGAARKKDPSTRLDYAIDFGERMEAPGFYFMDSPGNDLESIAGQVAAGCNLILFSTGNGSITNFPFVPTIKVMTTTARFNLVRHEMDFNAGRYQDGESLAALGTEALDYVVAVASGRPSAGERAGHAQVQLWREWRRPGPGPAPDEPLPSAEPPPELDAELTVQARALMALPPSERAGLVLPTSLCSGQIARLIAQQMNAGPSLGFARTVALPHTEGCGNSAGESEQLFLRTMAGYLAHPLVAAGLLLEHGCEKTHNDAFRNLLRALQLPEERFGFASVQMDGGIERVTKKVIDWFKARAPMDPLAAARRLPASSPPAAEPAKPVASGFALGLASRELWARPVIDLLAQAIAAAGGAAVLPHPFARAGHRKILYGERLTGPGVFAMDCPTDDLPEILTGLGGTGAEILIAFHSHALLPGNPLVPTLQVADRSALPAAHQGDADLLVSPSDPPAQVAREILALARSTRAGHTRPRSAALENQSFQITRGATGISL